MLSFERLESRCLLAAGISLNPGNGLLSITGDDNANGIFAHGNDPGVIVAGIDLNNDGDFDDPTDMVETFDFMQVRSLQIDALDGDDTVLVHLDGALGGDLDIVTRGGFDWVQVEHSDTGRNLNINTGGANDFVSLIELTVNGKLTINTQGGDDQVELDEIDVGGRSDSRLDVNTGAGDDVVSIDELFGGVPMSVSLGRGQDLLLLDLQSLFINPARLTLNGGAGNQDLLITADGDAGQTLEFFGASVNGFEHDDGIDDLSAASLGRLVAAGTMFGFNYDLMDEFHFAVDELIFVR